MAHAGWQPACRWCNRSASSRGDFEQPQNLRIARERVAGSEARRRHRGAAARAPGEFPPLAAHLLSVGEETGHLDAMFNRMADIYDTETRTAIRRFTSLFEPLMILVMGIMVGTLILEHDAGDYGINDVAV